MTLGNIPPSYCHIAPSALLTRFDRYLQVAFRARNTRMLYIGCVRRFSKHVGELLVPTRDEINRWIRTRSGQVSQSTVNLDIKSLRAFYRWAWDMDLLEHEIVPWIPGLRKTPQRLPRYLTSYQIDALLAAPDQETCVGFRDHVMMRLAYETGIRASEIVSLQLGSIGDRECRVIGGKGRYDRVLPYSQESEPLSLITLITDH